MQKRSFRSSVATRQTVLRTEAKKADSAEAREQFNENAALLGTEYANRWRQNI